MYISTFTGAVLGCIFLYNVFIKSIDFNFILQVSYILLVLIVSTSIFLSFFTLNDIGIIIAKSLWMLVSCVLAALIGFFGSVIVITVLFLIIFIKTLLKVGFEINTSSPSSSGSQNNNNEEEVLTVIDENGYERKLKEDGFDRYKDDKGNIWKDTGGGNVSRIEN